MDVVYNAVYYQLIIFILSYHSVHNLLPLKFQNFFRKKILSFRNLRYPQSSWIPFFPRAANFIFLNIPVMTLFTLWRINLSLLRFTVVWITHTRVVLVSWKIESSTRYLIVSFKDFTWLSGTGILLRMVGGSLHHRSLALTDNRARLNRAK